jgi:hypothetical protein
MKVFLAAYLASLLATPALATKSFRGGKEVVDFAAMVESSCAGASVDLRIVSAGYLIGNTAEFYLNGAKLTDAKSMRGMNVVYLNADDDAMEGSENFDTYLHHDEDDKMLAYLQGIPAGRIVMISAKDEAAKKCDDECETGLKLIGATIFPTIFRGSYIVAGRKDGAVIVNKQDGSKKIEWSGSTCATTPESHVKINYYSAELTDTTKVDTTAELETTVSGSTSTTADSGAYCTKDLTTMHRHANKNICSGGSNRNVMQRVTIKFYEPSTSGSDWQFRFNLDSTHGTVASIDGENVVTKSGDVWLGANKDMETPSKSFAKGVHEFLVVGAENCCDGEAADWEFKRGADHDWERITTESLVKIANTPDLNLGTLTSSGGSPAQVAAPTTVTQLVYLAGTAGNSVDETITGTLKGLVAGTSYDITVEVSTYLLTIKSLLSLPFFITYLRVLHLLTYSLTFNFYQLIHPGLAQRSRTRVGVREEHHRRWQRHGGRVPPRRRRLRLHLLQLVPRAQDDRRRKRHRHRLCLDGVYRSLA